MIPSAANRPADRARSGFLVRLGTTILAVISIFGLRELLDPAVTQATIAVVLLTFAVSWIGILLSVFIPVSFGLARVTPGGAFIASMNALLLGGLPTAFREHRQTSPETASQFVMAVLVSYLMVLATIALLTLSRSKAKQGHQQLRMRVDPIGPLLALSVVTVLAYLVVAWPPAIVVALEGGRQGVLAAARNASFASLEPAILRYLFGFVRSIALPLLSAYFVAKAHRVGTPRRWFAAGLVVSLAFFAAISDVQKAPSARLMLVVLLSYMLTGQRRRKFDAFTFAAVGLMIGAPIMIARWANSAQTGLASIVGALLRRTTELPAEVGFQYFRWADVNGHLNGAAMPYVPFGLSRGPVALSREIYRFAFETYTGQLGSANGTYIGFFWVDFGWFGVIFGSILVGALLFGLERLLTSLGPTNLGIAMRALIFVQVAQLPSTSLWSALLSFPFGMVDLLLFLLLFSYRVSERASDPLDRVSPAAVAPALASH